MPRSGSSSRSSSPRSFSKPSLRSLSPSISKTTPTPSVVHHEHKTSTSVMDGVKWGFGTSIGHSIGNLFGFGTQNVHVENISKTSGAASMPIKTDYDRCLETTNHEKKLSYCYEYDKCLQSKAPINCAEEAEKKMSMYAE